jgi:minor extracellular serine protease Vpr
MYMSLTTLNRKIAAMLVLGVLMMALPILSAWGNSSETGYRIIELTSPGAARYHGGIKGIPATSKKGKRFDPSSKAYASYRKHLNNEQANFRAALGRHAPQAELVNFFFITANAVVVQLNGLNPGQLKKISGAKNVYEVGLYKPHMDESVNLINAPAAWASVGGRETAGGGVSVAVIDSGIVNSLIPDFHPFFDCKTVEFGGLFYSGETGCPASGTHNVNGNDPAPCAEYVSDHGTHVAGTVGGCITTIDDDGSVWDGTELSGVAPGVTLVDYNVFPGIGAGWTAFDGSAFSHDIAAAIEAAVAAGYDVINMSLGGGVQGPHDFLAEVSNAAMEAGVVVVTAAGNEGPGIYTVGSPGSAANVITVGASTNTRGMGILINAPDFVDIKAYPGDFPNFDGSDETFIDWPGTDNEACTSDVADSFLSGEVVLIARGTCSFSQKVENANLAGAGGVVVYSDDRAPGGMAKTEGFDDDIPAVMISNDDGLNFEAALVGGGELFPTTITPPTIVPETPNLLADSSSRGPAPFTGIVKPDVVAPGVNILSSVFTGWELFNGTSMASPHVAGAAAVILQDHPGWTTAQVKSALATTATDLGQAWWEQGSGLINLEAALTTNAFFNPTNASFGTFVGKKRANGSVEISIDTSAICEVAGSTGNHVEAEVDGDTLNVDFNGGRDAPTSLHGGFITVDCDGQSHTIPWGAVVDRR